MSTESSNEESTTSQTNFSSDVNTTGGFINTGTIDTGGGDVIGRDQINYPAWPKIAIGAFFAVLVTFSLLLIELSSNLIEQLIGLTLQQLMWISGAIAAIAWVGSLNILSAKRKTVKSFSSSKGEIRYISRRQVQAFTGWYRRIAKITVWTIPLLICAVGIAYYIWIVTPAQYATILLADFVAPNGSDEALVTQTLFDSIEKTLADLPIQPNVTPLRIKFLHRVIEVDGGNEEATQIGSQPQHKAMIVIWGNYAIVAGDPEVHLHFDIVQPADTYLQSGFASSYGPNQISQLLQIEQPKMFDFKLPLGNYLGQMTVFTVGLTLFNTNRNKEAIPFFEKAGEAIGQPLASDFERGIRFYRGANYLTLGRAKDAQPDLAVLVPKPEGGSVVFDSLTLAALGNLGIVAQDQGDYAAAKRYLEQALEIDRQLGDPLGEAIQLGNLGIVAGNQGDYATAKRYHEQTLSLHRQLGNPLGEANQLGNLGVVAKDQGDYAAAKRYHEQALSLHRQLGNPLGEAADLGNLGSVAFLQGDYATAKRYHEQSMEIDHQLGNPLGEAIQLGNLGVVAKDQGDYAAAKNYLEQALTLHRQLGNRLGEANQLGNLGLMAMDQGNYAVAKNYLEQALTLHRQLGNLPGEARQLGNLGLVAMDQGEYAVARAYLEHALEIDRRLGNPLDEARDLGNLALVIFQQGYYSMAKMYLEQALEIDRQLGNPLGEASDMGNLGIMAQKQGDYATAKEYLEHSAELYHSMGLPIPSAFQSSIEAVKDK